MFPTLQPNLFRVALGGCLALGWLFAEIVSVLVGVRQDYRIIVSVLVGVLKGLSYYSQCVCGCLRTIVL